MKFCRAYSRAGRSRLLSLASAEAVLRSQLCDPRAPGSRFRKISSRLYATMKALWRLNWFLRDFAYDRDLLGRDEVDEKALLGLTGVLRPRRKSLLVALI